MPNSGKEDLEQTIASVRARIRAAAPDDAPAIATLLGELDELLGQIEARHAGLAADSRWMARSNAALEARLERLENSLVFRLLPPRKASVPSEPASPIGTAESSYR